MRRLFPNAGADDKRNFFYLALGIMGIGICLLNQAGKSVVADQIYRGHFSFRKNAAILLQY